MDDLNAAFEHKRMLSRSVPSFLLTPLSIYLSNPASSHSTTRFAVLGMSLSSVLDISAAPDFLRALLSLALEFDSVQEDRFDRSKGVSIYLRSLTPSEAEAPR